MDCHAVEQVNIARPSVLARMLETLAQVFPGSTASLPRLDLDEMPEQLKRDLGFLDGRAPHYEDGRMR
ncbi:hypothetical protein MOV66_27120 [Agrobacterium sp. SHOUNA12C]|uniref:Uncharacterized protein n=2 Tax=Rhizobium rhizogenes TaxID=359 RepID=B9J7Y1_RHIR8|nr:hypothetical protein [Rhizobium rhizogenes]ACM27302.1 hypothetical protein Arad_3315 [Rhizobium rhizogenes K84]KAA6490291.1 hypothetical protein DXT98_08015 [Agrobacterium sp. ICMP 7243]MCJ9724685.1 hypothetical protein [Agrobacterium sp. BETTINA12B]MCJ9760342.1 hypothetical protein [Agrobacterium sp. SHOUNA12C]KEA06105.1 hypothetical protein CN09_03725 [Rhizobium rhizogenes]